MRRGFTLLEVMISLAILAIALVAISGLNGGAVTMHAYGRRATEATLLLRGKMLDVEDDLQKNVREIRLTVSWSDGKDRRSVSASQIVVILPQGAVPNPALQNTVSPQGGQQVTPRSTQP